YPLPAILSILCGETALVLFYLKWIPAGAFLPVVWVMLITFLVYLLTHVALQWRKKAFRITRPAWIRSPYFCILAGIFMLAMDFWAWEKSQPMFMGIPLWLGYFILLSAIQTAVMAVWVRKTNTSPQ
ncbi:MAG: hypothetical protein B6245_13810, partial [Desulfobacteraceae bacterium 4572_88]